MGRPDELIDDDQIPLDASDALAAAICHLNARLYKSKIEDEGPT